MSSNAVTTSFLMESQNRRLGRGRCVDEAQKDITKERVLSSSKFVSTSRGVAVKSIWTSSMRSSKLLRAVDAVVTFVQDSEIDVSRRVYRHNC